MTYDDYSLVSLPHIATGPIKTFLNVYSVLFLWEGNISFHKIVFLVKALWVCQYTKAIRTKTFFFIPFYFFSENVIG